VLWSSKAIRGGGSGRTDRPELTFVLCCSSTFAKSVVKSASRTVRSSLIIEFALLTTSVFSAACLGTSLHAPARVQAERCGCSSSLRPGNTGTSDCKRRHPLRGHGETGLKAIRSASDGRVGCRPRTVCCLIPDLYRCKKWFAPSSLFIAGLQAHNPLAMSSAWKCDVSVPWGYDPTSVNADECGAASLPCTECHEPAGCPAHVTRCVICDGSDLRRLC